MRFKSIADVRKANKESGHFFFERDAMKFFNSRIESGLYGGRYFITSEQMDEKSPRRFKVRVANSDGSINLCAGPFLTLSAARIAASEVASDE